MQELYLRDVQPVILPDTIPSKSKSALGFCEEMDAAEFRQDCLLRAGRSLRKAVSRLPRLTSLSLGLVRAKDGDDTMYPWTQLK